MATGPSVLIVDDEPAIRTLAARAFGDHRWDVYGAANGKEAVRILEGTPIDVVVTDIVMPDMDGVEVIVQIKRRWPKIKMIAMSGGGRINPEDFLNIARALGVEATFTKPVNFNDIVIAAKQAIVAVLLERQDVASVTQ